MLQRAATTATAACDATNSCYTLTLHPLMSVADIATVVVVALSIAVAALVLMVYIVVCAVGCAWLMGAPLSSDALRDIYPVLILTPTEMLWRATSARGLCRTLRSALLLYGRDFFDNEPVWV
jgi:hypothetical protein